MSGIIHKESLPAQSLIKRRRVDASPTTPTVHRDKDVSDDAAKTAQASTEATHSSASDAVAPQEVAAPAVVGVSSSAKPHPQSKASSSSSSSSDDDESDNDDAIERENARLAKLREQRSRRQDQSGAGASASPPSSSPATASKEVGGTNSYDHDVLFRNSAWRNPAKATTAEEKRKQKWNAVLNRTEDSAAHKHFMKNYFK